VFPRHIVESPADGDRVLVVEDALKGYPPPGRIPPSSERAQGP
jgi:hypothetical protein